MSKKEEHANQAALFQWRDLMLTQYPQLRWMHAIPNGTRTSIRVATKMKREGVTKGVADINLPYPCGGYHVMWVEMKAPGGKLSAEQKEFRSAMLEAGYYAVVCWSVDDAIFEIVQYLEMEPEEAE
jgi:hypothetical protein